MKLQEKLSAIKQQAIATRPPEIIEPLLAETKKLVLSGIAGNAIKAGETLPEFSLSDQNGSTHNSRDILARGPLALSFYRGVW